MKISFKALTNLFTQLINSIKIANSKMENNIPDGLNIPAAIILIILNGTALFLMQRFKAGYLIAYIYYVLLLGLCVFNFKNIKKFFMSPFKLDIESTNSSDKRARIILLYPILVIGAAGLIRGIWIKLGLIPIDPQNLTKAGIGIKDLLKLYAMTPLVAVVEETFNLILVILIYKLMFSFKKSRMPISIFASSVVFGLLHVFRWNIEAALGIGLSSFPSFIATLLLGNIWVSIIAHFYQDILGATTAFSPALSEAIIGVVAVVFVLKTLISVLAKDVIMPIFRKLLRK